jgi:hypothetical protein
MADNQKRVCYRNLTELLTCVDDHSQDVTNTPRAYSINKSINQLVFITGKQDASCEVRTKFSYII